MKLGQKVNEWIKDGSYKIRRDATTYDDLGSYEESANGAFIMGVKARRTCQP